MKKHFVILTMAFAMIAAIASPPASAGGPTRYGVIKNYSEACAWVTVDKKMFKWSNDQAKVVPPGHQWGYIIPGTGQSDAFEAKTRVQMYGTAKCSGPFVRDMYEAIGNKDLDGYFAIKKINGQFQMPRDTGVEQRMPHAP